MDMPEEPHKNIEDALKTYAQQRRDAAGGPIEMPSHTRAVLQREVAQRAAAPPPEPQRWLDRLLASWPRLAVGAATIAVAGLTLFMLTDMDKQATPPVELAQAQMQSQSSLELTQAQTQGQSLAMLDRVGQGATGDNKSGSVFFKDLKPSMLAQSVQRPDMAQQAAGGGRQGTVEAETGRMKAPQHFKDVMVASKAAPAKAAADSIVLTNTKVPAAEPPAAMPAPVATPAAPSLAQSAKSAPAEKSSAELKFAATTAAPKPPAIAPAQAPTMPAPTAVETRQPEPKRVITAGVSNMMPTPAEAPATPAPTDVAKAERSESTRAITAAVSGTTSLSQKLHFAQVVEESPAVGKETESRPSASPSSQVMATFQLEQTGDRVVITDADGSVYEGRIQVADSTQQQIVEGRRVSRARGGASRSRLSGTVMTQGGEFVWREQDASSQRGRAAASPQSLYFTASGMNRSVNQRVVVNGVITSPADGELAYGPAATGGRLRFDSMAARGSNISTAPSAPVTRESVNEAGQMVARKASAPEPGLVVLPPGTPGSPVPAMPQASAQIEGTLRVGNAPETDLTAVGVGP